MEPESSLLYSQAPASTVLTKLILYQVVEHETFMLILHLLIKSDAHKNSSLSSVT